MSKVRLRRLTADYHHLREYVQANPRVELVQAIGNPPEKYQVSYQIKSLRKEADTEPVPATQHMVEIVLPRDYPRTPPLCRMLTSVFHPNIAPHAICIGDHWNAGEPLWSMVSRIGEMLAYQSFNVKSPLNGEAARWAEQNMDRMPLDPFCMIPETPPGSAGTPYQTTAPLEAKVIPTAPPTPRAATPSSTIAPTESPNPPSSVTPPSSSPTPPPSSAPPSSTPSEPTAQTIVLVCPGCNTKFRIRQEQQGKKFRCPKCKTIFR